MQIVEGECEGIDRGERGEEEDLEVSLSPVWDGIWVNVQGSAVRRVRSIGPAIFSVGVTLAWTTRENESHSHIAIIGFTIAIMKS
jgi:hypothetical protein